MYYCFKACDDACKSCSKCCDDACKGCGDCCAPCSTALDRPLGSYVLMSGVLNIPAAACAAISFASEDVRGCSVQPLNALCGLNFVLGLGHFAMALYVQRRLVYGLNNAGSMPGAGAAPLSAAGSHSIPANELMTRAGHIVCYDVAFCLYLFAFVGSFALQCFGFNWIRACRASSSLPWVSATLLTVFAFAAVGFAFLWYCALSCDACLQDCWPRRSHQPQAGQRPRGLLYLVLGNPAPPAGAPAPTVVGTSSPVMQGMPMAGFGGAPHAAHGAHAPSAPPPPPQYQFQQGPAAAAPPPPGAPLRGQQAGAQAAGVAAAGLTMVGQGLNAAGQWLDKRASAARQ